ncbi:MAG: hypothetical protein JW840_01095 [Candidatus Thermoplasmatota archaeon]|nr:hypothetical protein [Candidatus Thermoplasmatota archaeon]
MTSDKKSKTRTVLPSEKKTLLLYSAYLAIGSVSLFTSLVALNTAYQGWIWSYSETYIINSIILAFVLFISGALLIIACFRLIQARPSASIFGFVGIGFVIAYALFVLCIDRYIAYTLVFMLMLLILFALLIAGIAIFLPKKRS